MVEWGVNGRLTPYATSHVESVTFPSSHREKLARDQKRSPARPVGPAGPASRREVSLLFECRSAYVSAGHPCAAPPRGPPWGPLPPPSCSSPSMVVAAAQRQECCVSTARSRVRVRLWRLRRVARSALGAECSRLWTEARVCSGMRECTDIQ